MGNNRSMNFHISGENGRTVSFYFTEGEGLRVYVEGAALKPDSRLVETSQGCLIDDPADVSALIVFLGQIPDPRERENAFIYRANLYNSV